MRPEKASQIWKTKRKKTIEKLEVLKSDTASYVNQLDAELNSLNKQVTALNSRVAAKEAEIEEAEAELAASKEDERRQYESMKLRIQYMYEKGETSYCCLSRPISPSFLIVRNISVRLRHMIEKCWISMKRPVKRWLPERQT